MEWIKTNSLIIKPRRRWYLVKFLNHVETVAFWDGKNWRRTGRFDIPNDIYPHDPIAYFPYPDPPQEK